MKDLNLFLQPKEEVAVLPIENKTLLTSTKSDLSYMASLIVEAVDDGYADALDTLIMAKKGMYVFKSIEDSLKGKVVVPEKNHERYSCTVSERQTGVKNYFDGCNDDVWTSLSLELAILEERIKEREAWLKTFTKPTQIEDQVDEESGELIMSARIINPPVKTGGMSVIIGIK